MARVVVVGGGYGGLASAVRLAKLGHEVTLLEATSTLGGALTAVESEGFAWDAGPTMTHVPAVVRDLFRKSGRALEVELGVETGAELVPLEIVREHRFEDRSVLLLPSGRRAQVDAFDELGSGLGQRWDDHVASYAQVWDVLRRHYFEEPWTPDALPKEVAAILDSRDNLYKRLRKAFRDDRPATVAGHLFVADGHDLRNVPAWAGVATYLEQLFGVWTMDGGMHRLRDLLVERLATRGVSVALDTPVSDLVVRDGRVVAVKTATGEVAADVVVCAIDPRRLPTLAPHVERTMPALPPVVAHLGLEGTDLGLDHETVVHGNPVVTVRPGGTAPAGHTAWTLHGRGRLSEDMITVLARAGLDVRGRVVTRVDRTPYDAVMAFGGSPYGVLWQGRATVRHRLGPTTPVLGVYAAGAHATPGSGLANVGLGAALVATAIGPA
jgi:phytoene dehydrogenase-like protein